MDDPMKNAEYLIKKSSFILSHFDEVKNLPSEEISKLIESIAGDTQELAKDSVSEEVIEVIPLTDLPPDDRKHKEEMKKYGLHDNPRKRNSSKEWKHEILSKIESLEKELDEMKASYEREDKTFNRKKDCDNPSLLIDIVSSQSSSPIKSKSYGLFKPDKNTGNVDRASRISGCEVVEAKKIMDRGYKTARELNEKWELWKRKQKARKDVSLQVSLPEPEPTHMDEETKICHLAEKLTNMLLEEPDKIKGRTTKRHNIGNSVLMSSKSIGSVKNQCGRLAIQRLPDHCIKDALSAQALPSIVIPPTTVESSSINNTKLFCLNHSSKSENGNIAKTKSKKETPETKQTKKDQIDIGLQVELTDSDSTSSEMSIGHKLESLKTINKSLIDDLNQTQSLNDLLKKVQESSKICKKYRSTSPISNRLDYKKYIQTVDSADSLSSELSLEDKLKSLELKNKNDSDFNDLQIFRDLIKKVEELDKTSKKEEHLKSQLALQNKISVQSSASKSSKEISSRNQVDDYKSDFEVESLEKDNKSLTSSLSKISSIDNIESQIKPDKSPSIRSKRSKTPSLSVPECKAYLSISNTVSTDESILEAKMKRLGISPERITIPRKPSEGKGIKCIHKEHKLKASTKSKIHRNTLYVKSDGGFIPFDSLDTPNVQIIVPEIVVKLPDTINTPIANVQEKSPLSSRNSASSRHKQDRLIQTEDMVGPSGDANVVDKLNKHFERTQLLLDRIGSMPGNDIEQPGNSNILSYLHRRHNINGSYDSDQNGLETSPGEINRTEYKYTRPRHTYPLRGEFRVNGNSSESIGEVYNGYR